MLPAELQKIMFLDIETVPQTASLAELPAELAHMWEEKYVQIKSRMPFLFRIYNSRVYIQRTN